MKRPVVEVTVQSEDGTDIGRTTKSAFNSGVRATESLVRSVAREKGVAYVGSGPIRVGDVYRRVWRAPGAPTLIATVAERIEVDA